MIGLTELIVYMSIGIACGIIIGVLLCNKGIIITIRNIVDYKEPVNVNPEEAMTPGTKEFEEAQYQARKAKEKR